MKITQRKGGIGDPYKPSFFSDRNATDSIIGLIPSTAHDSFLSVNGLDLSACNHGTEYLADLSQLKKIFNHLSLQPGVKWTEFIVAL